MDHTSFNAPQYLLKLNNLLECRMNIVQVRQKPVTCKPAKVWISHLGYKILRFTTPLQIPVDHRVEVCLEIPLKKGAVPIEGELVTLIHNGERFEYEVLFALQGNEWKIWAGALRKMAFKQNFRLWEAYRRYSLFAGGGL